MFEATFEATFEAMSEGTLARHVHIAQGCSGWLSLIVQFSHLTAHSCHVSLIINGFRGRVTMSGLQCQDTVCKDRISVWIFR